MLNVHTLLLTAIAISKFAWRASVSSHNMAAPYVKPTKQHKYGGLACLSITDTAMENFANVVYTSRELNLSNRLFEDSSGFGEPQRIFLWSANACVSSIYILLYRTEYRC